MVERYDRVVEDVFAIQDEISRAIAEKLEVKLRSGERVVVSRTRNIEAYNLYLKGRQQWFRRTPAGYRQAEEFFRRAVAEDAGFIPSLLGLADCLTIGTFDGNRNPADAVPEARALLERAVSMDASLAETHTSLGFVELVLLNGAKAEEHFGKSEQLKPEQALNIFWQACLAAAEGRLEDAIAKAHRAVQIEPTIPVYPVGEGLLIVYSGRLPLARRRSARDSRWTRSYPLGLAMLGQTLAESGHYDEGIELLRTAEASSRLAALGARTAGPLPRTSRRPFRRTRSDTRTSRSPVKVSLNATTARSSPAAPTPPSAGAGAPRADGAARAAGAAPTAASRAVALTGRRAPSTRAATRRNARRPARRADRENARRLWNVMPLPMMNTPSSRSGASARPIARCSRRIEPALQRQLHASARRRPDTSSLSGTNVPWSKPRARVAPRLRMPAASSSSRTRDASPGSPGAGHVISYDSGGKP